MSWIAPFHIEYLIKTVYEARLLYVIVLGKARFFPLVFFLFFRAEQHKWIAVKNSFLCYLNLFAKRAWIWCVYLILFYLFRRSTGITYFYSSWDVGIKKSFYCSKQCNERRNKNTTLWWNYILSCFYRAIHKKGREREREAFKMPPENTSMMSILR